MTICFSILAKPCSFRSWPQISLSLLLLNRMNSLILKYILLEDDSEILHECSRFDYLLIDICICQKGRLAPSNSEMLGAFATHQLPHVTYSSLARLAEVVDLDIGYYHPLEWTSSLDATWCKFEWKCGKFLRDLKKTIRQCLFLSR